ncbi:type II secretion system inner membrane protein GspF [Chitinibacter bivalviorum]|uniref:Type II secretion system inner membrane protein GspF n=1 Tax=Chitinibacter bivalviorum TaxID=2739434 RepID=A0A7H9BM33_9NEIS|nr:type II secretion system inner membrane protein GspF [Chitinibacter bivalviorum]QLG89512.1 type II secretion system inner membrane protein GspF [Chitinibacter bivalviorum]
MSAFRYQAVSAAGGKPQSGQIDAESARHARSLLREQGLHVLQLDAATGEATAAQKIRFSSPQLATLTRQFSALLDAGLTIDELLVVLAEQADQAKTQQILAGLRRDVMAGMPLSNAMDQFPRVFPLLYRTLVKAGEESGKLAGVMQRLADYLEARGELNTKIALAFIYPAVVMFVSALVILGMLTWVVPQMVQVFESAKQTLPLLTRALLWTSAAVKTAGIWVALALALAGVAAFYALKKPDVKLRFHRWRLTWPMLGYLDRLANTARFASTLAILVGSGVPLLKSLDAAEGVMSNLQLQGAVGEVAGQVREGVGLARAMKAANEFPPLLLHLVSSGEATGRLANMLDRASIEQTKELDRKVTAFTSLLGPLMVLVMGGVVMLIVLAILLPVFEMNQLVK